MLGRSVPANDDALDRQAGSVLSTGETPSDGYAIYPTDPEYKLLQAHTAALKARDG